LDYASGSTFNPDGVNVRVQDGFDAFTETIDGILKSGVNVVIHGGDLFHASTPSVRGLVHAREQLDRLYSAGIPFIGVTGNHDASNSRYRGNATLAAADPGRNITIIDTPYETLELPHGIVVHAISHGGLIPYTINPVPTPGALNILLTHGAAEIDGYNTMFTCEDSPAEAWIPSSLLQQPWDLLLTGHYHRRHKLPLPYQAHYAGSSLRRGFSDEAGSRGWLEIEINDSNDIVVTEHDIYQRPQFDLAVIDAAGLTGDEVFERIRTGLVLDTANAPIVRQKVINISSAVRKTIPVDQLATSDFLQWQLRFARPEVIRHTVEGEAAQVAAPSLSITEAWNEFVANDTSVLEEDRSVVATGGKTLLEKGVAEK
jgi:DNA repair exonuclease SbcCD nuclease subunit